jgi:hypothetical protein
MEDMIPHLMDFRADPAVLITQALDGYAPLVRKLASHDALDPDVSVAAALALGRIHGQCLDIACLEDVPFPLPIGNPMTPEEYCGQAAEYPLFAARMPRVETALQNLAEEWRQTFFIHGDFKADNLHLNADPGKTGRPRIVVVDWELAGRGEPLWDVGSYVGSVLAIWIDRLGHDAGAFSVFEAAGASAFQRQIGHFLITYRHLMPEAAGNMDRFVLSSLRYAGIFFLHRVLAGLSTTGRVSASGSLMLHMAEALLIRTERAAAVLLPGLR